jgi:hypothetical protein
LANLLGGYIVVGLRSADLSSSPSVVIFVRSLDLPATYVVAFVRSLIVISFISLDLPTALSLPSSGRSTSLRLHRHLRQLCRRVVGSLDLPSVPSSPSSGRQTSLQLCRHLRQLRRPPYDFTSRMKASQWGARLMALPSTPGCLGAFLRPS